MLDLMALTLATIFLGVVIRALEIGLGQKGARRRRESITNLASIQEALSVMSFKPMLEGLFLIEVTVTGGVRGVETGVGTGAEEPSATEMTVVPILVERGSGGGVKSTNGEDGAGKGMTGAPPIVPGSWMVIDEIPPWLVTLLPIKLPIKTVSGTRERGG